MVDDSRPSFHTPLVLRSGLPGLGDYAGEWSQASLGGRLSYAPGPWTVLSVPHKPKNNSKNSP